MHPLAIDSLGYLAQLLFSARFFVQWILSERARRVLSPTIFWQISLVAACIFCLYGWLRNDFSIILGQFVTYYIYIWNLNARRAWKTLWPPIRWTIFALPLAGILWIALNWSDFLAHLFIESDLPGWLIALGTGGQLIFTLRFVYQWWYSRQRGESILPLGFWLISLTGSTIIIAYALIRGDMYPLILGHLTGAFVYTRNIIIFNKQRTAQATASDSNDRPCENTSTR